MPAPCKVGLAVVPTRSQLFERQFDAPCARFHEYGDQRQSTARNTRSGVFSDKGLLRACGSMAGPTP